MLGNKKYDEKATNSLSANLRSSKETFDFSDSETDHSTSASSTWDDEPVVHTIILPNYKEDLDTLRETLDILASHSLARSSYEIYLAMEQGELGCELKATGLQKDYKKRFRHIEYTVHPRGIAGEAQGKSSNLCWAAKYINGKYRNEAEKRNIIVTVMDSDSHLLSKYFTMINNLHYRNPHTASTTMYVPPLIFDRNAHLVPRLVRVADLLWAAAGLSSHYEGSTICPPTSVYSLPLSLVDLAGGWDAGREAIGEDLHMYIKCFFALNGHLTTRSVYSAASHSNVNSSGKGLRAYIQGMQLRYKQAMRHMWGSLDSGFAAKSLGRSLRKESPDGKRLHRWNTWVLMLRLFEAHFLPQHITFLILGGAIYKLLTPAEVVPRLLRQVLDLTGYMRIVTAMIFIYFFILYEPYHKICLKTRETEMSRVDLADRMTDAFSHRSLKQHGLDFCVFPVAGVVFGTVPAVVAMFCQFWTLDLVYNVSMKPTRMQLPSP
ncbi:uncharacterized protein RCO7_08631 [Rhynchosporium graminicola]|uniref:Glycosyltransferase 2-like domain-containing protein n=1 Tax=Rhynchosporium graminicola TaxID=2792576 RepID=A0A1E1JX39_9HELO|nr:uncharacterized protein RCO7_08631 [Rhynchosporium commune]